MQQQEPRSWLLAVDGLVGQAESGKPMYPNLAALTDANRLALQVKSPGGYIHIPRFSAWEKLLLTVRY